MSMFGWTKVEEDWLIYDGIDSVGARNRPTDRQLVLGLCLPWYLSDFSLIWFLLGGPEGVSWWAWALWTVIFCSSCFMLGSKKVSKRTELDRWLLEQKGQQLMLEPTCQSFTHTIHGLLCTGTLTNAFFLKIFFNVVHNDNSTTIQAPWQRTVGLCS